MRNGTAACCPPRSADAFQTLNRIGITTAAIPTCKTSTLCFVRVLNVSVSRCEPASSVLLPNYFIIQSLDSTAHFLSSPPTHRGSHNGSGRGRRTHHVDRRNDSGGPCNAKIEIPGHPRAPGIALGRGDI